MKRTFAVAGLLVLVLSLVSTAQAWYPGWGRGMGPAPGWGVPYGVWANVPGLNPTAQQLSQWKELVEKFGKEILPLRNQLISKRMELAALLAQPDANPEAIKSKHREVIALEDQIQDKAMDHRLGFRQTLTPEQLSLWISYRSARRWWPGEVERQRGRGPMHGMRPGGGMGPGYGLGMGLGCCYW